MVTGHPGPLISKARWEDLLGNETAYTAARRLTPTAGSLKS